MSDSGFKVIKHPRFISFWGDHDSPPFKRANWYSANRSEDRMIDYIDRKLLLENTMAELETKVKV